MGNCVDRESASSWVEDDDEEWDSQEFEDSVKPEKKEGDRRIENGKDGIPSTHEVKIRITKKQLEQLLQGVDGRGLSIQQVLTDLMSRSGDACLQEQHWRPRLQSIPEVPE